MGVLRNLALEDIPYMLEWMHDKEINQFFQFDAEKYAYEDAERFIRNAQMDWEKRTAFHWAIIGNNDEYMGTISLKNVDLKNKNAEYAISTRRCAWGTGLAKHATEEVLEIAFHELKLHKVYLNVIDTNIRAIEFYKKCNFQYEGEAKEHICINGRYVSLKWFAAINYK